MGTVIHLTDTTQNSKFQDKYFSNIDIDLSRSLIIFSYNDDSNIHPVLKDRIVQIHTSGYNIIDKINICKHHMIKSILQDFGYKDDDIVFEDDIIKEIISNVEKEEGVRNLKRGLIDIVSNINLQYLLEKNIKFPFTITKDHVGKFLVKSSKGKESVTNSMYI